MSNRLEAVVERARRLGFVGTGPAAGHVEHARGFAVVAAPGYALDLGSGGGLPGLVLSDVWPDSRWMLLDANERRAAFLEQAVSELGVGGRVTVRCARAEQAAHEDGLRGAFDLVVARSFGPPAVTAECAVGFLRIGGLLVVSEPPDGDETRWPATAVGSLGLRDLGRQQSVRVFVQVSAPPPGVPRRVGVPTKRPRW